MLPNGLCVTALIIGNCNDPRPICWFQSFATKHANLRCHPSLETEQQKELQLAQRNDIRFLLPSSVLSGPLAGRITQIYAVRKPNPNCAVSTFNLVLLFKILIFINLCFPRDVNYADDFVPIAEFQVRLVRILNGW